MNRTSSFDRIDARTAPYAGLVLRVALGVDFIAHALLKWLVLTLPGTAAFFASHGFPGWSAYVVFVMELVGGLLLIAGVRARWVALALVPVALGAMSVSWPNGWYFAAPHGGWEYTAFLTVALVTQALIGNGACAWNLTLGGAFTPGSRDTHAGARLS